MQLFSFTITIEQYLEDLDVIDSFYAKVDDASIATGEGKTLIHFDREADSLDQVLRGVIADLHTEGWQVREISVEPDCLLPLSAP